MDAAVVAAAEVAGALRNPAVLASVAVIGARRSPAAVTGARRSPAAIMVMVVAGRRWSRAVVTTIKAVVPMAATEEDRDHDRLNMRKLKSVSDLLTEAVLISRTAFVPFSGTSRAPTSSAEAANHGSSGAGGEKEARGRGGGGTSREIVPGLGLRTDYYCDSTQHQDVVLRTCLLVVVVNVSFVKLHGSSLKFLAMQTSLSFLFKK